jgi:KDO2-lipid IV(A) lauroyltransferase
LNRHSFYLLAVVALLELTRRLAFLPLEIWLAHALGALAYRVSAEKRRRIETNLERALGNRMDAMAQRRITREVFTQFWVEMLSWANTSRASAGSTLEGQEHLEAALAHGKGAILWESNGFGRRATAQRVLCARGFAVTQVHALSHLAGLGATPAQFTATVRRVIHPYLDARERERVSEVIYLAGDSSLAATRTLTQRLSRNAILCVAAEGRIGQRLVHVNFLGQTRGFATGMVSLAQFSGAPLLPFFSTPNSAGGVTARVMPPLALAHARRDDVANVIAQYAELLEKEIRARPEWYRQWDTLDRGDVSPGPD